MEHNADLVTKDDNSERVFILLYVEKYQNEALELRYIIVELQAQLHQSQAYGNPLADNKR